MSTRIFPDLVVSVNIKSAIRKLCMYYNVSEDDPVSKIQNNLNRILISPDGCVERQSNFINNGLCNVFVGYGNNRWTKYDYIQYFKTHGDIFVPLNVYFEDGVYKVIFDNYIQNDKQVDVITVKEFSMDFCGKLLTQGAYNPLLLKKYGLVE